MRKSGAESSGSDSQSKEQFAKIFESHNLLLLKSCDHFTQASKIPGVRFTPARSSQAMGIKSYFSGYVFKADIGIPYDIFRKGFQVESPFNVGQSQSQGQGSISGGVLTSLSAIATSYAMVRRCITRFFVYLIDAMDYNGILEEQPNMPKSYRYLEPYQLRSCNVRFTHPIFNSDIVGCVWSDQFPNPQQALWPPRLALGPTRLSLAVNPDYHGGRAKAEEIARLFSFDFD